MSKSKVIWLLVLFLLLTGIGFGGGYYYANQSVSNSPKIIQDEKTVSQTILPQKQQPASETKKTEDVLPVEPVGEPEENQEVKETEAPRVDDLSGKIVRLDVVPQVQRAWNTCAPTTVSMLLSYKGVSLSQEELAREMGTDEIFGTHNANAIQVLNHHLFGYAEPTGDMAGYRLERVTDVASALPTFKKRLIQNIKDGYPMYYTFDVSRLQPGKTGEHNVLGIGYQLTDDGNDVAAIYYLDPSYTVQDSTYGGLKKITPEELLSAMIPCVEPEYAW